MNASGLGFAAILLVVLLLVVTGAQEIQAKQAENLQALTTQRDELLRLADEARAQRDAANARADLLFQEKEKLVGERDEAGRLAEIRLGEIERLQEEINVLARQVAELRDRNASLQAGMGESIPVTGQVPENAGAGESMQPVVIMEMLDAFACRAGKLPGQVGLSLGLLAAGLVLGAGGRTIASRLNPHRKISVRMTRDQLDGYIRYRRTSLHTKGSSS